VKIKYPMVALCAVASIFFASCGSTKVADANTEENTEVVEENTTVEDFTNANSELLAKVEEARKAAIDAKAQTYYRALFDETETKFVDTKSKIEKTPKINYADDLNDLLNRYQSMEKASLARELKEKADLMDKADLDAVILKKGEEALAKYDGLVSSGSGADLLVQAEIAYDSYFSLVNKGFIAMAGRERKAALAAKKDAESVKAQVAKKTKDSYNKAAEIFKKADVSYSTKNIEKAFNGYKSSKEAWAEMFEIVKKDRAETEAKLAAARQKVFEAEQVATTADTTAPLTEKVSGIEDENAVLLEEDKFANSDELINDVESSAAAETAEKMAEAAISAEEALNNVVEKAADNSSIDAK